VRKLCNILTISSLIGLLALIALGQSDQTANKAKSSDALERQIDLKNIEFLTTASAFSRTLSAGSIPGGISRVIACGKEQVKHALNLKSLPVRQVLDAIVLADPEYRWQIKDGVVNLFPSSGWPALLNVRVAEFNVDASVSVYVAAGKLFQLPEAKRAIAELHLAHGYNRIQGGSSSAYLKSPVHCKDITLLEALNAIALAHGRAVWAYSEIRCNGRREFTVEFLVL